MSLLTFEHAGSGPPILFLHGIGGKLAAALLGAVLHDALLSPGGLDQQLAFAEVVAARFFDVEIDRSGVGTGLPSRIAYHKDGRHGCDGKSGRCG